MKKNEIKDVKSDEDGYLVNIIWDQNSKESNIQIFDAKTMDPLPIACVTLPYRIPVGFHSKFLHQ